jgi:hypothetical protein
MIRPKMIKPPPPPPPVADTPFLVSAAELRDRKSKRRRNQTARSVALKSRSIPVAILPSTPPALPEIFE